MEFMTDAQGAKHDMTGASEGKKAKFNEVKAKGGTWLTDKAYEANKPQFNAKPGYGAKPMSASAR